MKDRKDLFFGIHCDFHAKPSKCDTLGGTLREEDIRKICTVLKPDFIQIDCKGHPGWASYPSKLGNAIPGFECDTLAMWRKVTREEGVELYMHYSGIFDIKYCEEHPEECTVLANGNLDAGTTLLGGKYVDELLIPQICELAEVYDIDGVWIDGECWKACPDFRKESLEAFEKATGIELGNIIPATPDDPYYHEYREYFRERFRSYLRHYVDTLHEKFPDLQIASNWAFSDHMPEKVSANVDFLSGDLNPVNSCYSARYAGRALAQHGYAWDLMSWNFRIAVGGNGACISKHRVQIIQEAAEVIALGGAFQNYVMQNPDGSPQIKELLNLNELSEFVRSRKDFCFRGKPIHQAAILLSSYDRAREMKKLYARTGYEKICGLTALMCDIGQSTEIVSEHTLENNYASYEMIVVPELFYGLDGKTVTELLAYVQNGGKLVLVGKKTCELFSKSDAPFEVSALREHLDAGEKAYDNGGETGHANKAELKLRSYVFTLDGNSYGALFSPTAISAKNADIVAYVANDTESDKAPLAVTVKYGNGNITAIGFDIGTQYINGIQYLHRTLMRTIADSLYTPIVKVENALGLLEIVCLEKDGRLMIQLINGNGQHTNPLSATEDFIPPVLDIRLSIKTNKRPSALMLQPEGRELSFEYENGFTRVNVERLDIHSVIEVIE